MNKNLGSYFSQSTLKGQEKIIELLGMEIEI